MNTEKNYYVVQQTATACVLGIYEASDELEAYNLMLEEAQAEEQDASEIPEDIKIDLVVMKRLRDVPNGSFVYDIEGEGFWVDDEDDLDLEVYFPSL